MNLLALDIGINLIDATALQVEVWRIGVVEVAQHGIDKRLVAPKDGYLRGLSAERVEAVGLTPGQYRELVNPT